jgi:hypothetical protein
VEEVENLVKQTNTGKKQMWKQQRIIWNRQTRCKPDAEVTENLLELRNTEIKPMRK